MVKGVIFSSYSDVLAHRPHFSDIEVKAGPGGNRGLFVYWPFLPGIEPTVREWRCGELSLRPGQALNHQRNKK
jgi:hypothetical protein